MARAIRLIVAIAVALAAQQVQAASLRPRSYLALRFEATVPQAFDYTCGASSVATMLTYYWGRPTTENDALNALRQRYSLEEIAKRRETGLTFDDLIFMANRLGFEAEGARIAVADLAKLNGPVIVHLRKQTFQHFVVLRGVGDSVYYLSDPIVGQITMSAAEFTTQFTGNLLTIYKRGISLPDNAILSRPRDGLSVTNTLDKVFNRALFAMHPIL